MYKKFGKFIFKSTNLINELGFSNTNPIYTLINNLPDNVFIKNTEGEYIIANDRFAKQININNIHELIGKKDSDFYTPEVSQKYFIEDQLIISGEKKYFKRDQKSENDGITKHTTTSKFPIKDKNNNIIGLVGISSDISEQYEIHDKIQKHANIIEKEKNLLRTLLNNMPDTIYIKDVDGHFLDVNPTQIAVSKASSREDMINKCDHDFYPKDIADIFLKDDKQVIETGKAVINKEEIGFDTEGNIRVKSTTKVPFYDENGKIAGLVGIGRDITKLKETEEKLIEQAQNLQEINVLLEERQEEINQQSDELSEQNKILESERNLLRTLIDNIPDFIYVKDKNSRFITANKFFLEISKVKSLDKLGGKTDSDFYPKEMAEKYLANEKKIIENGEPLIGIEETTLDEKGNIMHILTSKVPFRDVDGDIIGIVGIGKDITIIKETELKLKEQAEYLSEVNVLLEERQEEIQQQSSELSSQNKILENERNLLRTLIDTLPDHIYIKDSESKFITANKALIKNIKAPSLEYIEGKTDFDFFTTELAQKFYNTERIVFESGKPIINHEEVHNLEDGKVKVKSVTKVPYFDDDGRIIGIVGISKDISKIKEINQKLKIHAADLQDANQLLEERAEEIQKQSKWLSEQNEILDKERSLLRTLIDNMPDYIYIKDIYCNFITVNKRLQNTMRVNSLDDVIGKSDLDFGPSQEIAKAYYKDDQKIITTGQPLINKEEIGFDEHGKERIISTTKVPFRDAEGRVVGIVGIGRDITKQKNTEKKLIEQADSLKEINILLEERQEKIQLQAEDLNKHAIALKKSNSQLEELNATKNKFFSIIAHDLKNPFQAIFGFSELLMRNFEDFEEEQRIDLLQMIKTSSESAYNLLENLLQWARTQTDRIKYNPSTINIQDLIDQNLSLSMPNAEKKQISFKSRISDTGTAWADFNMVNLIIRNLLSNAIKFTSNKGIIKINCKEYSADECLISISDNGVGISKDNIKKLFKIDEYFSTSGTSGEGGTGLGLIICKDFVEKNHGKLMVESELDVGTTFSFTLPLKKMEHFKEDL